MRGRNIRPLWLALICVALSGSARAWAQASGEKDASGLFTVTVTNELTGEPLAGAQLQVTGCGIAATGSQTRKDGRVSYTGVTPGICDIKASRAGFLGKDGVSFAIRRGQGLQEMRIPLAPAGAIEGRVLDDEGNPVEHARVVVIGIGYSRGFLNDSPSDAQGRFRIGQLSPGKYRLRAEAREIGPPETRTDGTKDYHFAPTYYGGTLTVAGSKRIEVRPGEDARNIEVKLLRAPLVSISGRVIGFPSGVQPFVRLRPIGQSFEEGAAGGWNNPGTPGVMFQDGTFRFWRVNAGTYSIEATSSNLSQKSVRVDLAVGGRDIDNVELRYAAPMAIEGWVEYLDEGALWGIYRGPPGRQAQFTDMPGPLATPPPMQVILRLVEDGINEYPVYATAKDGRFTIPQLRPGRYRVGAGVYVEAVRWGGQTYRGDVIDVHPGMAGQTLMIALSFGLATVSGVVRDARGPVSGTMVYLIPENGDPLAWKSNVQTREDGSYTFTAAPGKYRVVAVEPDDLAARAGLALEEYAVSAEWLDLHPRDQVRRDLRVGAN